MIAWTDYPIVELGDIPGKYAPIREIEVLSYDGNKYCEIIVGQGLTTLGRPSGFYTTIKAGYIYQAFGRLGEVPAIDVRLLPVVYASDRG